MFKKTKSNTGSIAPSALQLLAKKDPFKKTLEERAEMTISCRDSDYIPKVKNAGSITSRNKTDVQIMHNGLLVKRGGYYGDWMQRIITELKGHHEPQEEKIFFEILKRVKTGGTMIELGSFWSYYSLWFHKKVPGAVNVCCEPDPNNLEIGKTNARLNDADIVFLNAAAGSEQGTFIDFPLESQPGKTKKVPILPVDEIVKTQKLKQVDVLHMDVQGAEISAIKGAEHTIKRGKLRFLLVSTHHYSISGDPLTHFKCADLIKSLGGHIIAQHTIPESFSGDGLIAASFYDEDSELKVDISVNSSANSLYEPYEYDLATLIKGYESIRGRNDS